MVWTFFFFLGQGGQRDWQGRGTVRAEGLGGQRDWQGRGTRRAEGLAGQRD